MAAEEKKEQKKKVHVLKRRVYHDRYFAYAIALLLCAGVLLVGYVVVVGNRFSTDSSYPTLAQPNKVYTNSEQGYSVSYRPSWVLEVSPGDVTPVGMVSFENPANYDESFVVIPTTAAENQKELSELKVQSETDFTTANGVAVKMLAVAPAKTIPIQQLAIVSGNGKFFIISGSGVAYSSDFMPFVQNFKITP